MATAVTKYWTELLSEWRGCIEELLKVDISCLMIRYVQSTDINAPARRQYLFINQNNRNFIYHITNAILKGRFTKYISLFIFGVPQKGSEVNQYSGLFKLKTYLLWTYGETVYIMSFAIPPPSSPPHPPKNRTVYKRVVAYRSGIKKGILHLWLVPSPWE